MRSKGHARRPSSQSSCGPRLLLQSALLSSILIALLLTASRVLFRQNGSPESPKPDLQPPVLNDPSTERQQHITKLSSIPLGTDAGVVYPNKSIGSIHAVHALFHLPTEITSLEDTLHYLQQQSECSESPIFVTMAAVGSDIYWQLIENFMFTMKRFQLFPCAIMICVSDDPCYKKCLENHFPCYNYHHIPIQQGRKIPSTMEQIAHLKLLHIPKALSKGVDIFTLDLDVGFYGISLTL